EREQGADGCGFSELPQGDQCGQHRDHDGHDDRVVIGCLYLILSLDVVTWIVFAVWLTLGMIIYFAYGFRRSRLATGEPQSWEQDPEPPVVR
ncbi:MAG: amino acid permease C-terminal domain-containing protein, partial [Candidatus Nanopelagicales bacterium]